MTSTSKSRPTATGRVLATRSRRRQRLYVDTTLTDSWPPRLNTAL